MRERDRSRRDGLGDGPVVVSAAERVSHGRELTARSAPAKRAERSHVHGSDNWQNSERTCRLQGETHKLCVGVRRPAGSMSRNTTFLALALLTYATHVHARGRCTPETRCRNSPDGGLSESSEFLPPENATAAQLQTFLAGMQYAVKPG